MSSKISAVKPSQGENVAKESNKGRSSTRDFISIRPRSKKDQCWGLTVALTATFGLGFEHMKVSAQNYFLFL